MTIADVGAELEMNHHSGAALQSMSTSIRRGSPREFDKLPTRYGYARR